MNITRCVFQPPETSGRDRYGYSRANKSFIRYRMPMPNIFSVVAKETNSGEHKISGLFLLSIRQNYK